MKLEVRRLWDNGQATIGMLLINNQLACFTLEDTKREVKIKGETRIPEGTYKVELRTEGASHERYKKRFPSFHKGMLHIVNVPNFQFILIHIGNSDKDTEGCLLVGDAVTTNSTLLWSTQAYERIYKTVASELILGNNVSITFKDYQPLNP